MMDNKEQQRRYHARKVPRQLRSRSTVAAIKQAAYDLIATEGFSSHCTSTASIAARAGIGIGSLYDYFPSREAVFLALYEDISSMLTVIMKKEMVRILSQPPASGLPRIFRRLLTLFRKHELVMLKMVTQMPELKLVTQPLSFENMVLDTTRIAINQWNPELSSKDLDRRAFLLREITLGSIQRYLNDLPENVQDRALVSDLTQIATYYISLPSGRASI